MAMPEISPPPPIGTTSVSISGAAPSISSAEGPLSGDHQRIVVGVDEGQAALAAVLPRKGGGLLHRLARAGSPRRRAGAC